MEPNHGALSDAEHKGRYAAAIREARLQGGVGFQAWFNVSESETESLIRGCWDFSVHILRPAVVRQLSAPHQLTALEIGYGGGRIIHAASLFFGRAIGVDVHEERDTVAALLAGQGRNNVTLLQTNGRELPVESNSIDLVYSFIVLQHLPTLAVLESYVRETARVLRPGGVAQLYVGAVRKLPRRERLRAWLHGYAELSDQPVNFTSLVVSVGRMKAICRAAGLRVIDSGVSHKRVPDGYSGPPAGQDYVTAAKPA